MLRTTESVSGANPLTGVPTDSRKDDRQYIPSVLCAGRLEGEAESDS